MPGAVQHVGEVLGAVAGAVVGDDPLDVDDAVGGKPDPGTVHETDCGDSFLIGQGLGVGQSGEPIDGGVQVDVTGAGSGFGRRHDGFGLSAALSVYTPASAIADVCDLLDVDVDHMAGPPGNDALRAAISGRWDR